MSDSTNNAVVSGITRLPAETLLEIFEHLIYWTSGLDDFQNGIIVEYFRCVLTEVCTWWRELAINHPALWAVLFYVEHETIRTARNWTRLCLARSNNRELRVALELDWRSNVLHKRIGSGIHSFIGTLEDDLPRIRRFFLSDVSALDNADSLTLIPHHIEVLTARLDHLCGLPSIQLPHLRRLDLKMTTLSRQQLSDLFGICSGLQHFTLRTSAEPRHCMAGQSMYPPIFAPELISLGLLETIVPARAFLAPNLVELVSCPSAGLGRERFWWQTNHCQITTPSHQEDVKPQHFPQLRNLTVGTMYDDIDWLEPSVRLAKAHPEIHQLALMGGRGTGVFLKNTYALDGGGIVPSSLKRIFIFGGDRRDHGFGDALRSILSHAKAQKSSIRVIWTLDTVDSWFQKVPFEVTHRGRSTDTNELYLLEEEFPAWFKICEESEAQHYFLEGSYKHEYDRSI